MELIRAFPIGGRCWRVAMTPDGQRLAIASYSDLQVWDADGKKPLWSKHFPDPTTSPSALAFSPDGDTLAMTFHRDLHLLSADTGEQKLARTVGLNGSRMDYTKDGQKLILTGHHLAVLDQQGEPLLPSMHGPRSFNGFSLNADESLIAAVGEKSLWIYDLTTGEHLFRYPAARFGAQGVALSPDGALAWVTETGDVASAHRVGKKTKKIMAKARTHGGLTEIVAHPDWRWILLAAGNELYLHDPANGERISKVVAGDRTDDMVLNRDATLMLSAHLDGTARLWKMP